MDLASIDDVDILCDVLVNMGALATRSTQRERLRVLVHFLFRGSPRVRYGSMTGLCALGDPVAVTAFEVALFWERVPILQSLLHQSIAYLERKERDNARRARREIAAYFQSFSGETHEPG